MNYIKIGQSVSVGDRCMIHCSGIDSDHPTIIGNNVILGSGSILHGCTVEDDSIVGEGAQVMDGAKVSSNSILLGGSLLTPGKVIPPKQVWGGAPAKYVRDVTDADTASLKQISLANIALASQHQLENSKTWQTIENEEFDHEQIRDRDPSYYRRLTPEVFICFCFYCYMQLSW